VSKRNTLSTCINVGAGSNPPISKDGRITGAPAPINTTVGCSQKIGQKSSKVVCKQARDSS